MKLLEQLKAINNDELIFKKYDVAIDYLSQLDEEEYLPLSEIQEVLNELVSLSPSFDTSSWHIVMFLDSMEIVTFRNFDKSEKEWLFVSKEIKLWHLFMKQLGKKENQLVESQEQLISLHCSHYKHGRFAVSNLKHLAEFLNQFIQSIDKENYSLLRKF